MAVGWVSTCCTLLWSAMPTSGFPACSAQAAKNATHAGPPSGPGCRPAAVAAAATMIQTLRGRSGPQQQRRQLPAMMTRRCLMLQRMAWTSGALQLQVKTNVHC